MKKYISVLLLILTLSLHAGNGFYLQEMEVDGRTYVQIVNKSGKDLRCYLEKANRRMWCTVLRGQTSLWYEKPKNMKWGCQ